MNWNQACAYWDRGAISTADLYRIAHELFEGEALQDVLCDVAYADLAAQDFIVPSGTTPVPARAPAPQGR